MTIRFQKRIKIVPGLSLNIGKNGVSASVGPRGAKMTVHSSGARRTSIGLPGSGLSVTSYTGPERAATQPRPADNGGTSGSKALGLVVVLFVLALFAAALWIGWRAMR